jgi:hypothetical protein
MSLVSSFKFQIELFQNKSNIFISFLINNKIIFIIEKIIYLFINFNFIHSILINLSKIFFDYYLKYIKILFLFYFLFFFCFFGTFNWHSFRAWYYYIIDSYTDTDGSFLCSFLVIFYCFDNINYYSFNC